MKSSQLKMDDQVKKYGVKESWMNMINYVK